MTAQTGPSDAIAADEEQGSAQVALFPVEATENARRRPGRRSVGRHEKALGTALKAARLAGKDANPVKAALNAAGVSLCRALACQMDAAELYPVKGMYAMPQLAAQYQDALKAIGLLSDGGGDDDLLGGLGDATLEHASDT